MSEHFYQWADAYDDEDEEIEKMDERDIESFPFSCGAVCLGGFGGGEHGQWGDREEYDRTDAEWMMSFLKSAKRANDPKIIFAVTTSNQPWAAEFLQKFGFYTSREVGPTSGDRTIQGWFLPICEFDPDKVQL